MSVIEAFIGGIALTLLVALVIIIWLDRAAVYRHRRGDW